MNDLVKMALVIAAFLGSIGIAWLIASKLGFLKSSHTGEPVENVPPPKAMKFMPQERVLSQGELMFLPVLRDAVRIAWNARGSTGDVTPLVLASVRLAEILKPAKSRSADLSAFQSAFNMLASKQVDFVICEALSGRPLLIIELDDQTHERADRKERDAFVNGACLSAGLPILHVRAAMIYSAQEVASRIVEVLPVKK